MFDIQNCKQ